MRVCTSVEVAKKIIKQFNMVQQDVRLASELRHRVHLLWKVMDDEWIPTGT